MSHGVLLLGTTPKYRDLAVWCIRSLRRTGYAGPIRCVIDEWHESLKGLNAEFVVVRPRPEHSHFGIKTEMYWLSPWERTLYMDVDIMAVGPIDQIFNLECEVGVVVDGWFPDFASKKAEHLRRNFPWIEDDEEAMLLWGPNHVSYNAGMIYFTKTRRTEEFWRWIRRDYLRFKANDQNQLNKALYYFNVDRRILDYRWNYSLRAEPDELVTDLAVANTMDIRLLHFGAWAKGLIPKFMGEYVAKIS